MWDETDESNCDVTVPPPEKPVSCTESYYCEPDNSCIPLSDICNGATNCADGFEEEHCDVTRVFDSADEKRRNVQWFLNRRSNSTLNKWGLQLPRTAVALYLSDPEFFAPGNKTGQEIRYEMAIQLLSTFKRHAILRTEQLALYVHALLVSCLNPRDFYGRDLVSDLRLRVDTSKYVSPMAVLVLCNAGDPMTDQDVARLKKTYVSRHRSYWTEIQVLSTMALSCISSKSNVSVDLSLLRQWIDFAKDIITLRDAAEINPRTVALVIQLMLGTNYSDGFNWRAAVEVIKDPSFLNSSNFLDKYYLTPVLNNEGLTAIDRQHCGPFSYNDMLFGSTQDLVNVQYTVWADEKETMKRSWGIRMPPSSTLYDVILKVQKLEPTHTVKFNVVDGKPYVRSVSDVEEDPETDHYWFMYQRALKSADDHPQLLEGSPLDIRIGENQEFILWYRNGVWNANSYGSGEIP